MGSAKVGSTARCDSAEAAVALSFCTTPAGTLFAEARNGTGAPRPPAGSCASSSCRSSLTRPPRPLPVVEKK